MILFIVRWVLDAVLNALLIKAIISVEVINEDDDFYKKIWETDPT